MQPSASFYSAFPIVLRCHCCCVSFSKSGLKLHFKPFILGIISYLAFSFCLVNVVNGLLLMFVDVSNLSPALIFIYSLCTQVVAALIAQSGKYYTLKILKNDPKPDKYAMRGDALEFGAGYSGIESIMTVGITMMSYMVYAGMLMAQPAEEILSAMSGDELANAQQVFEFLTVSGTTNLLAMVLQGLSMILFQIGSSLLIYRAVFSENDKAYFRLAVIFHIIMIVPGCITNAGIISGIWFETLTTLVFGAAVLYYAYDKIKEYEKQHVKDIINTGKGKKTLHVK